MNKTTRIVYGSGEPGGHHLLPELLQIGWGKFPVADCGHLGAHGHLAAFELCLITSGEVEWCAGGTTYVLRSGDVFVTRPHELHGGRDGTMHPCTLYWLIVGSPSFGVPWPFMDGALAHEVQTRLSRLSEHRIRAGAIVEETFREVFESHHAKPGESAEALLLAGQARAALHRLLIGLARTVGHETSSTSRTSPLPHPLRQAIEHLRCSAGEPNAVQVACGKSGGYDQISRQCLDFLGMTLSQFWLRERVRLARERLLDPSVSVTDIATELGFSSSQHFATVFRRFAGYSPSRYRLTSETSKARRVDAVAGDS